MEGVPMSATNYQSIDYDRLFGSNPFTEKKNEIENLIVQLREKLATRPSSNPVGIDDPEVTKYMESSVTSQRKLLNDYVKAAAGAAVKRGGFGIMGAPRLDSSLTYSAIQNLAKDYSTRLKQALGYAGDIADSNRQQYQDDMLNLQKLLGVQKGYLSEEADWKQKLATAIRDDWEKQIQWMRDDQAAKSSAETNRAKYAVEQLRAQSELQKLQQEIKQKLQDQAAWDRLMKKAGLLNSVGPFGAGWTTADDYLLKKSG